MLPPSLPPSLPPLRTPRACSLFLIWRQLVVPCCSLPRPLPLTHRQTDRQTDRTDTRTHRSGEDQATRAMRRLDLCVGGLVGVIVISAYSFHPIFLSMASPKLDLKGLLCTPLPDSRRS